MLPRFDQTRWSLDDVVAAILDVPWTGGPRRYTRPHPAFRAETITVMAVDELKSAAEHVGWQTIVIDAEEPVAVLELTGDAMGDLVRVSVVQGELPHVMVSAFATAEDEGLTGAGHEFAVISLPAIGLMAVWFPEARRIISIGADVHETMARGSILSESAVLETIHSTIE
jgi:hypothetical protein